MDDKQLFIIKECTRLFMTEGIKSITMDDVSKHLAISKKTLYKYFSNKTTLLTAVINYKISQEKNEYHALMNQKLNAIEKLSTFNKAIYASYKNTREIVRNDLQYHYADLHQLFKEKKRKMMYDIILNNIEQGKKEGLYRNDIIAEAAAQIYINHTSEIHSKHFNDCSMLPERDLFKIIFEYSLRSMATPEGIKQIDHIINTK